MSPQSYNADSWLALVPYPISVNIYSRCRFLYRKPMRDKNKTCLAGAWILSHIAVKTALSRKRSRNFSPHSNELALLGQTCLITKINRQVSTFLVCNKWGIYCLRYPLKQAEEIKKSTMSFNEVFQCIRFFNEPIQIALLFKPDVDWLFNNTVRDISHETELLWSVNTQDEFIEAEKGIDHKICHH